MGMGFAEVINVPGSTAAVALMAVWLVGPRALHSPTSTRLALVKTGRGH